MASPTITILGSSHLDCIKDYFSVGSHHPRFNPRDFYTGFAGNLGNPDLFVIEVDDGNLGMLFGVYELNDVLNKKILVVSGNCFNNPSVKKVIDYCQSNSIPFYNPSVLLERYRVSELFSNNSKYSPLGRKIVGLEFKRVITQLLNPTKGKRNVINVYQSSYVNNKEWLCGLGDILRGSIATIQLCHNPDQFQLYLGNHPIGYFFEEIPGVTFPEAESVIFYRHNNYDDNSTLLLKDEIAKETSEPFIMATNIFPDRSLTRPQRKVLQSYLTFRNDFFEGGGNNLPTPKTVIHIRAGDPVGVKYISPIFFNNICRVLKNLFRNCPDNNYYLISDNQSLLKSLPRQFPQLIVLSQEQPVHLSIDQKATKEQIKNTLMDFYLLTKAEKIFQLSIYGWGSGFSKSVAEIFDIPLETIQISEV